MVVAMFALASCAKESSDTSTPSGGSGGLGGIGGGGTGGDGTGGGGDTGGSSKTQMLTAKTWKTLSLQINPAIDADGNGTTETDITQFYDVCMLDNFYQFNSNLAYTYDEGPTKCDPNAPQTPESGTWAWNTGETQITLTVPEGTYSLEVATLTTTQLITNQPVTFNNANHTLTVTWN